MGCVTIRGQRCEITTEISAKGQSRTVLRRRFHGEKRKTGGVALPGSKRTADHSYGGSKCNVAERFLLKKRSGFYAGYLDCNSENMTEYLGETVSAVIDGIVKGSEQRISRALLKLAVQSAIQSHILAAVTDVDETDVGKLYGMCTEDVRRTNGIIDFRNAYKYQKED